jgi:CheY-like chemotaxis protein
MEFDLKNGNMLWGEATDLEMWNMIPSGIWATRTLHHLRQDRRRSIPILSMTASMTADTRNG